jgi:hypothetical protein
VIPKEPPETEDAASSGTPAGITLDDQAWYTHDYLAKTYGVGKEALRKRLDRYRQQNMNGWKEDEDRRPREPKYLFRLKAIRGIIEDLQASSERPAK